MNYRIFFSQVNWRGQIAGITLLVVSAAIFTYTWFLRAESEHELIVAKSDQNQQAELNRQAATDLQILNANKASFNQMQEKGIVGDTHRLQWLELTHGLSKQLHIPLADYTLANTSPVDESNIDFYDSELSLYLTNMSLNLSLRHEGEFFQFMDGLRLYAEGLFNVDSCEINRNAVGSSEEKDLAGIEAKCQLQWYSIAQSQPDWEVAAQ